MRFKDIMIKSREYLIFTSLLIIILNTSFFQEMYVFLIAMIIGIIGAVSLSIDEDKNVRKRK